MTFHIKINKCTYDFLLVEHFHCIRQSRLHFFDQINLAKAAFSDQGKNTETIWSNLFLIVFSGVIA